MKIALFLMSLTLSGTALAVLPGAAPATLSSTSQYPPRVAFERFETSSSIPRPSKASFVASSRPLPSIRSKKSRLPSTAVSVRRPTITAAMKEPFKEDPPFYKEYFLKEQRMQGVSLPMGVKAKRVWEAGRLSRYHYAMDREMIFDEDNNIAAVGSEAYKSVEEATKKYERMSIITRIDMETKLRMYYYKARRNDIYAPENFVDREEWAFQQANKDFIHLTERDGHAHGLSRKSMVRKTQEQLREEWIRRFIYWSQLPEAPENIGRLVEWASEKADWDALELSIGGNAAAKMESESKEVVEDEKEQPTIKDNGPSVEPEAEKVDLVEMIKSAMRESVKEAKRQFLDNQTEDEDSDSDNQTEDEDAAAKMESEMEKVDLEEMMEWAMREWVKEAKRQFLDNQTEDEDEDSDSDNQTEDEDAAAKMESEAEKVDLVEMIESALRESVKEEKRRFLDNQTEDEDDSDNQTEDEDSDSD